MANSPTVFYVYTGILTGIYPVSKIFKNLVDFTTIYPDKKGRRRRKNRYFWYWNDEFCIENHWNSNQSFQKSRLRRAKTPQSILKQRYHDLQYYIAEKHAAEGGEIFLLVYILIRKILEILVILLVYISRDIY